MSNIVIGMALGIAIGFAIGLNCGIIFGKKQKPWSEFTEEEKRQWKILIGAGIFILVIGCLTGLWQYLNF